MKKCAFHPGDIARIGMVAVCLMAGVQRARAQSVFDAGATPKPAAIVVPVETLNATPQRAAGAADGLLPSGLLDARYTLSHGMTQSLVRPAAYSPFTRSNAVERFDPIDRGRPKAMVPLYVSMVALQGLDVASTRKALAAGGVEANPMMAPFVGSAPGMIAVKIGVSGAMIFACEKLWKTNRKAAIFTLIGTNLAYAAVVSSNYAIAAHGGGTR